MTEHTKIRRGHFKKKFSSTGREDVPDYDREQYDGSTPDINQN